jgi:hypothetical protein
MFISAVREQYDTAPVASDEMRFTPISVAPVAAQEPLVHTRSLGNLAPSTSVVQEHGVIIVDEVVQEPLVHTRSYSTDPLSPMGSLVGALAPPTSVVIIVDAMQVDGEGDGYEGDGGGDGDEGDGGDGEPTYYGSEYHDATMMSISYSPTDDKSSSSSSSPIIRSDEDGIDSDPAPTLFPGGPSRSNGALSRSNGALSRSNGGPSRFNGDNVPPPMASYLEQVLSSATQKRIICTAIDRENNVIQKIRAGLRWFKVSDKKFCLAILSPHDAEYYWAMSSELVAHKYLNNSVGFFDGMKTYSPNGNRIIQRDFHFRYPQYFGQKYVSGRSTQEHHVKMIEFLLTTGHCTINRAGLYFLA